MQSITKIAVQVMATVNASIEKVWEFWTNPIHIVKWNHASDEWHAPHAENDLKVGGSFKYGMAAKDGTASFNFEGIYTQVRLHELIEYLLADGRTVSVNFTIKDKLTIVTEDFVPENMHPVDIQRSGWQAILDNFKKYVEEN